MGYSYISANALVGASRADILKSGYVPDGQGRYRRENNLNAPGTSGGASYHTGEGTGTGTSGPYGDYGKHAAGTFDIFHGNESYTDGGGGDKTPTYKRPSGSGGGALAGLQSMMGGSKGSGGSGLGGLTLPSVGASVGGVGMSGSASAVPTDSKPPEAPDENEALPMGGGGNHMLGGLGADRQGLGGRVPPSLASLLKPRVY